MLFEQTTHVVGVFATLELAGQELDRLVVEGFPLKNLFLVANNLSERQQNGAIRSGINLVDQVQTGAISGTAQGLTKGLVAGNFLGGVAGGLLGLGILALPGVGQIALTSAVIFTLMSSGVGIAAGGMIGALLGLGLTEKQVKQCHKQLSQGKFLLIVSGTEREIQLAERLLNSQSIHY
jgi:hypothetical protein